MTRRNWIAGPRGRQPAASTDVRRFAPGGAPSDLVAVMTERRYSEEEVAAIFGRATEAQQSPRRQLPPGEGMTLDDLQEIGREVGIPPELVVQAARSMDQRGRPATRTYLGLPIGVGRTIDLDRRLSEEEWEHLVIDLRDTFDAQGTVRYDGPFRQWTNGNLQALLEPTATGHRLRRRQMEAVAARLALAAKSQPPDEPPTEEG